MNEEKDVVMETPVTTAAVEDAVAPESETPADAVPVETSDSTDESTSNGAATDDEVAGAVAATAAVERKNPDFRWYVVHLSLIHI